jgi:carbon storage regulator
MLVLTRKLGEIIRVGDAVTVRVLEVRGNQVRLGVDAPAEVRIYREEVYRAIQKEHEAPEDGAVETPTAAPNGNGHGNGGEKR